jgi:hypothetical protein
VPIIDPHCHTTASDGMVTPSELVAAAVKAGLNAIAVTDHDTMRAVKETQERGEAFGLQVIPGQEITTAWPGQTHVQGWFLEEPVKRGMTLLDTVRAIHAQGALAIIPHPFMPVYFGSIQPRMLRRLIEEEHVDGIEMLSTVPIGAWRRRALESFVARHGNRLGAPIGASDSHFGIHDIARVVTEFEGDFRTAVVERRTRPRLGKRHPVPAGIAMRQQWRALVEVPLKRLRGQL